MKTEKLHLTNTYFNYGFFTLFPYRRPSDELRYTCAHSLPSSYSGKGNGRACGVAGGYGGSGCWGAVPRFDCLSARSQAQGLGAAGPRANPRPCQGGEASSSSKR